MSMRNLSCGEAERQRPPREKFATPRVVWAVSECDCWMRRVETRIWNSFTRPVNGLDRLMPMAINPNGEHLTTYWGDYKAAVVVGIVIAAASLRPTSSWPTRFRWRRPGSRRG